MGEYEWHEFRRFRVTVVRSFSCESSLNFWPYPINGVIFDIPLHTTLCKQEMAAAISNIDVIYYLHIATATTFPLADGKQNLKSPSRQVWYVTERDDHALSQY
jgi:hypothetical protein